MIEIPKFNPLMHHRQSIRMKGYDYSLAGAYFITIATYQHTCIFGEVLNDKIKLNKYGCIAFNQWIRLTKRFRDSDFPAFVIMPNHVHGIILIGIGTGTKLGPHSPKTPSLRSFPKFNVLPGSLGAVVRAYKAAVTYRINVMRDTARPPIWQRNYYEHIIRNEEDYETIWNYIETNPQKWIDDRFYQSESATNSTLK